MMDFFEHSFHKYPSLHTNTEISAHRRDQLERLTGVYRIPAEHVANPLISNEKAELGL
jgi:hypothetical protein